MASPNRLTVIQAARRQLLSPDARRSRRLRVRLAQRGRVRHLREALDLQHLGGLDDVRQPLLGHVHLAVVHEVDEGFQVAVSDILQDHYRVLARVQDEQGLEGGGQVDREKDCVSQSAQRVCELSVKEGTCLEICAASGQDDFVRLQLVALRGQCDIHQVLIVQQGGEDGYEVRLVIVPPQTELLHGHRDCGAAFLPLTLLVHSTLHLKH